MVVLSVKYLRSKLMTLIIKIGTNKVKILFKLHSIRLNSAMTQKYAEIGRLFASLELVFIHLIW